MRILWALVAVACGVIGLFTIGMTIRTRVSTIAFATLAFAASTLYLAWRAGRRVRRLSSVPPSPQAVGMSRLLGHGIRFVFRIPRDGSALAALAEIGQCALLTAISYFLGTWWAGRRAEA
jgi:hypothetical protein